MVTEESDICQKSRGKVFWKSDSENSHRSESNDLSSQQRIEPLIWKNKHSGLFFNIL